MDVETMTLTEFLLARIAEDEEAARAFIAGRAALDFYGRDVNPAGEAAVYAFEGDDEGRTSDAPGSPGRVLAECKAKRRIVELHTEGPWECPRCVNVYLPDEDYLQYEGAPCQTLKALGAPYADHPDFRPGWRL